MTIIDRNAYLTSTPWFNTPDDVQTPKELRDEASQWNVSLGTGELTRQGIKERVWANAHNQNVYLESIEQRLEAMESKPTWEQPRHRKDYIDLQAEIADIQSSSSDDFSDVFNDKLTLLSERAERSKTSEDPPPSANH